MNRGYHKIILTLYILNDSDSHFNLKTFQSVKTRQGTSCVNVYPNLISCFVLSELVTDNQKMNAYCKVLMQRAKHV